MKINSARLYKLIAAYIGEWPLTTTRYREFTTWSAFLNSDNHYKRPEDFMSFKEALRIARALKLTSIRQWYEYRQSHDMVAMPARPEKVYRGEFVNWAHFLGYRPHGRQKTSFHTFEDARNIARKHRFASQRAYKDAVSAMTKESLYLPVTPQNVYKEQWVGWKDYLGNSYRRAGISMSFQKCSALARKFGIKSGPQWRRWWNLYRPDGVPRNPEYAYKNKGWRGWGHFLQTGYLSPTESKRLGKKQRWH